MNKAEASGSSQTEGKITGGGSRPPGVQKRWHHTGPKRHQHESITISTSFKNYIQFTDPSVFYYTSDVPSTQTQASCALLTPSREYSVQELHTRRRGHHPFNILFRTVRWNDFIACIHPYSWVWVRNSTET